jgi:hypothetical protein
VLTVVMVIEDVLRISGSEGHLETGWGLYRSLAPAAQLYLLTHEFEEDELGIWLRRRRLTGHLGILRAASPGPTGRLDALERVRSWRVGLVIESDPACAAAEIQAGWCTLLHTHAAYTRPSWRPDAPTTPRPWDQLLGTIAEQQILRDQDERTEFKDT